MCSLCPTIMAMTEVRFSFNFVRGLLAPKPNNVFVKFFYVTVCFFSVELLLNATGRKISRFSAIFLYK